MLWSAIAFGNPVVLGGLDVSLEDTGGGDLPAWWEGGGPSPRVVGGAPAAQGEWDDAVGVVFQGAYVGCTGTLIAPNVVITAAHCAGGITDVLIGSKNWAFDNQPYEMIRVDNTIVHPSYNGYYGFDVALLILRRDSAYPPRVIASDCVLEESLYNGAPVTIVGFGNTDTRGETPTLRLMAADTAVVDFDCSQNRINGMLTGCDPALRPGGELGAGGNLDLDGDGQPDGVRDACFGDSGGPLYLRADRGDFLVGVTSRAFLGSPQAFPCREGGVYARPDALIEWIERRANITLEAPQCNDAPTASLDRVRVRPGKAKAERVAWSDPEGTAPTLTLESEPTLGSVSIDGDVVTFTAHEGVRGSETVMIGVTDGGSSAWPRSAPVTVMVPWEVTVGGGVLPACGCASAPGVAWSAWVLPVWLLVRRARRGGGSSVERVEAGDCEVSDARA